MTNNNFFITYKQVTRLSEFAFDGIMGESELREATDLLTQISKQSIPDLLICPCRPNSNGFCTFPSECIAKRMIEQEDCDNVCKSMQSMLVKE